jgi:hypothetical protein
MAQRSRGETSRSAASAQVALLSRKKANKPKVRATPGGSHPEAKKLESLQALHAANCKRLQQAGLNDVFAGQVPVAEHVARASTEEERIRKLAAAGTITAASMWHHTGEVCINGPQVFPAMRIASEAKQSAADSEMAEKLKEYTELKTAAKTVLSIHGIHRSATAGMALSELSSVVKFVHSHNGQRGSSNMNSKHKCVSYLEGQATWWTELVDIATSHRLRRPFDLQLQFQLQFQLQLQLQLQFQRSDRAHVAPADGRCADAGRFGGFLRAHPRTRGASCFASRGHLVI